MTGVRLEELVVLTGKPLNFNRKGFEMPPKT
jgi:hypothetical protein